VLLALKNLSPDFESFARVIKGEKEPEKVYFVELLIDEEIKKAVIEKVMGEKWSPPPRLLFGASAGDKKENPEIYWQQHINFYYKMGYDFMPDMEHLLRWQTLLSAKKANDTAKLSRGKRSWALEGKGIITCWEDFEKFPWKKAEQIRVNLKKYYDFLGKNLPEGMKIAVIESLHEQVLEFLLGYEGLFYLIYEKPDLVKAVFDRWGKIVYDFYESVVCLEKVGVIWHADDLGFKTATLLSPEHLRKFVFPWHKKYSFIAHNCGKPYWYHCCGYKYEVMEDLIEDVGIDAIHSFEDVCCPVIEFKKKYGHRIGILGGVDMDKLSRLDEKSLRKYIKNILEKCMPDGRFALGAGNSVANYVPVKNYLTMLDEGLKWK